MPTAKRLPSGSWRCLAYSHSIIKTDESGNVVYGKNGKPLKKRIYESFTSDDTTKRGKIEAEALANDFILNRKGKKKNRYNGNLTLLEAIEKYIEEYQNVLSPSSVRDYNTIKRNAFQDIMNCKLKDFDEDMLQDAIDRESCRISNGRNNNPKQISPKRVSNEYGLIRSVLKKYNKNFNFDEIKLPKVAPRIPELLEPSEIYELVHETDIELPVLLAIWFSFTMSEIRGLTKSKSLHGDYLTIREVVVDGEDGPVRKKIAKNEIRNRRHRVPKYIKDLIDRVDGDIIVPMSGSALYQKWIRLQKKNHVKNIITFHDLRHVNASVMALLQIPDKYAQERGGWKTDTIMKSVYQQTFSSERIKVDDTIDAYFENILQHKCNTKKEKTT